MMITRMAMAPVALLGIMTTTTMMVVVSMAMPREVQHVEMVKQIREKAAKSNVTCILVLGDSSVDPGNNNYIPTDVRSNFLPYGKDFFNGSSTGRFTNGRLATDFIAEAFGYRNIIRGFLDPNMEDADLLHGVSFASAGSGYDDFTANLSNVVSISKQVEYLMHYKIHLRQLVGKTQAEEIMKNAILVISFGTNDFIQNYFIDPTRPKQFTLEQYHNYLISRLFRAIKAMSTQVGSRRVGVVGIPPLGCFPLVETIRDDGSECDAELNKVAISFNAKIQQNLASFNSLLPITTAYIDIYGVIERVILNPKQYGFAETSKGCCGTGTVEFGDSCKGLSTCSDPTKYVYWDAVHPTESLYKIVAEEALKTIIHTNILD